MHYSLMGKIRLPFIDSDLLYRGALNGRFDCILNYIYSKEQLCVHDYEEINF